MDRICDAQDCTGCSACQAVCPKQCISMVADAEGFLRPSIDASQCIDCGLCAQACPINSPIKKRSTTVYMGWNRSDEVLARCASGGVFDALAALVLERGGIVYGAATDGSTRRLFHQAADSIPAISSMRLSKYYQSDATGSYKEISGWLRKDRWVLFTGTPCQVAGLYAALGDRLSRNPRLITMEVLCHGVTSKLVVDNYVESKERRLNTSVLDVKFRTKDGPSGWEDSSHIRLLTEGQGDDPTSVPDRNDTFMLAYGKSLFLRESCYRCKFCNHERVADVMAGDFWGVTEERASAEQRRKGVSLLLVAEDRKGSLLPALNDYLHMEIIDLAEAVPRNSALYRPTIRNASRSAFFSKLPHADFDALVYRLLWKQLVKNWIKNRLSPKTVDKIRHRLRRSGT